MHKVTIENYQRLAMKTCLPSAKNWEYCYTLIASEVGEAFGKWGKKFRDGEFDKEKLADELGDVFWGLALACELGGHSFEELWGKEEVYDSVELWVCCPIKFAALTMIFSYDELWNIFSFAKTFAQECGIDPLECLRRNIAKLAGRKERGTLGGNGDER